MKIESTYDFRPIFTLTHEIVLFQAGDSEMVAKVNFSERDFIVDNVNKLTKFAPYDSVLPTDKELQIVLTNNLYKCLPDEVLFRLFDTFSDKDDDVLQKAYLQGVLGEDVIEKAWKKHPIGTTVTRKDGHKYTKISETGDTDKDWQMAGGPKGQNNKPAKEGNKGGDNKKVTDKQPTAKELKEHAKNTSETALRNAIKDSSDHDVRKIAQHELHRRETEEKPKAMQKPLPGDKPKAKPTEPAKPKEAEKSPFEEKFNELSDSQLEFYLDAPNNEVKKAAKKVLTGRGLRNVPLKEYMEKFADFSAVDEDDDDARKLYKSGLEKVNDYFDKNNDIAKAVVAYQGSLFVPIRKYLSDPSKYKPGEDLASVQKEVLAERVEQLTKYISDNKIKDDLTLNRMVMDSSSFFRNLNKGDIYQDKSFSSTSLVKLEEFGDFNIKILAKKGSSVAQLDNTPELEYLIDKGVQFRVVETNDDNLGITVEIL